MSKTKKEISASSVHDIKRELKELDKNALIDLVMRLAKFKSENKELLTYLLFHSENEQLYIASVKKEMDAQFKELNKSNIYLAKKTIRKVLRTVNKHIRFSGNKETEVELRIYYCDLLRSSKIAIHRYPVLVNLYENQLKKIETVLNRMHEDLRYDYENQLNELRL